MTRTKKHILHLFAVIPILFLINYLFACPLTDTEALSPLHDVPSVLYGAAVLAWGESVRSRILQPRTRHLLFAVAMMLSALFLIRLSRWEFFWYSDFVRRLMVYLYYIPFILVPLFSFLAAVRLDPGPNMPSPRILRTLTAAGILLSLLSLTNDLHGWILLIEGYDNETHRWLYYVIVLWTVLLSLSVLAVLIRSCRLSRCRGQLYVPLMMSASGCLLLAVYAAAGGSPELFGEKMFFIQEAYALAFIGLWEGCIVIGLLPSNMGYRKLFPLSHISAAIVSADRAEYYSSVQIQTSDDPDDLVAYKKSLSGGTVTWTEDIHAVRALHGQIAEANESLAEENDLIEEETRINSERLHYETQNRLYDRIAAHSHTQLTRIAESFSSAEVFTEHLRENILLGTYVKRSANLMLLAGKNRLLSVRELVLALHETMENLRLFSIDCALCSGETPEIPAQMIVAAYDAAEQIAEAVYGECSVISAEVMPDTDTLLAIETDAPVPEDALRAALSETALTLTVSEADGAYRVMIGGVPHDA